MAEFNTAVSIVLNLEGGYVDHPADSAGETNMGITYGTLKNAIKLGIVPRETDVRDLTKQQAMDIYKAFYWQPLKLEKICSQSVANKILEVSVNVGLHWGTVIFQRAVHSSTGEELKEDGKLGPKTLVAINNAPSGALLASARSEQAGYYRCIITKSPSQSCFAAGWFARAYK